MEEQKKSKKRQQEDDDFIDDDDVSDEDGYGRADDAHEDDNENDEDFNEDNEDDEDYEEYGKNKKRKNNHLSKKQQKKKKQEKEGINKFFEQEAEENEDESISDVSDDINNEDRKKELKLLEEVQKQSLKEKYRAEFINLPEDQDQLRDYFDKKYQQDQEEIPDEIVGPGNEEIVEQYQLPSNRDPRVFAVRCRAEQERETVAGILNKFIYYQGNPQQRLEIHSAAFIDKFPGFIYIEADKEGHVRQAIKGFRSLEFAMGQNQIQVMPIEQVPLIYTCDSSKQINIEKGNWIRIKKGPYENDLGQVLDFDESKTTITVKLIPRLSDDIDDTNENVEPSRRGAQALQRQRMKNKKNIRPEQKLFVVSNYKDVQTKRDQMTNEKYVSYKGMHFQNGFLYKKMNIKNIEYKNVEPTLEEVQFFIKCEKDEAEKQRLMDQALVQLQKVKDKVNNFQKGDKVKVIEGDLKNLIGIVSNTDGNEVTIIAEGVGITDAMNFKPSEIVKYFKIGDYVKINEGKYKGQCGPIIKLDDIIATVVTEGQKSEVKCLINNLQATVEVNAEVQNHKNQKFLKFDLIKLFNNDMGCIILRLGNENLTVLDDQGQQQIISYFQIDQKIMDKNTSLKNKFQQNLTINSIVKITDGVNKNKQGIVKHIYKNTLFLYNTEFIDTVGIFVENANNCYLVTSNLSQRQIFPNQNVKENPERAPFNQQDVNNQPKEKNPTAQPNKDPILGKTVVVRKGPYKGYEGVIKAADDRSVRIELAAKCKIIQLPRDVVLDEGTIPVQPEQMFQNQAIGSQTPQLYQKLNPQSPYVGGQSPAFMASPGWGFAANSPGYKTDHQI